MSRLIILVTLLGGLLVLSGMLVAQDQKDQNEPPPLTITQQVTNVVAPVYVTDRSGNSVSGLRPDQFRLFDNSREQNIQVYETYTPISMVVCIQANSRVDKMLPTVNKIGNLLKPVVLGDQGEAAVIAYDSRVRVLQEFTSDSDKITQAVKKITAGSMSNRLIDAVDQGIFMLSHRPKDRRRIMLVIGETRDQGSGGRGRETLINLQLANVVVYWVDMSHLLGILTQPGPDPRPDNLPPAMHPMPSNTAATPSTVEQTYGLSERAEFLPLMLEIYKQAKNIFKTSPANLFTKGTGGNQFSYYKQRGLEESVAEIGQQLHSQYLLSYSPNNREEGGFHSIQVEVVEHDYKCQTRVGYWVASKY